MFHRCAEKCFISVRGCLFEAETNLHQNVTDPFLNLQFKSVIKFFSTGIVRKSTGILFLID